MQFNERVERVCQRLISMRRPLLAPPSVQRSFYWLSLSSLGLSIYGTGTCSPFQLI